MHAISKSLWKSTSQTLQYDTDMCMLKCLCMKCIGMHMQPACLFLVDADRQEQKCAGLIDGWQTGRREGEQRDHTHIITDTSHWQDRGRCKQDEHICLAHTNRWEPGTTGPSYIINNSTFRTESGRNRRIKYEDTVILTGLEGHICPSLVRDGKGTYISHYCDIMLASL